MSYRASGWIKFDKDMDEDPRLLEAAYQLSERYALTRRTAGGGAELSAAEELLLARNAVTGALLRLWRYADEHIRADDTLPMSSGTLDAMVGIIDFFDIMPREWIDELDDGTVILPGYCEKNSLIAKRKAAIKSNARVTAFRQRKKVSGNTHVTHSTPRYKPITKVVDQDLDLRKKTIQKKVATRLPEDFTLTVERTAIATRANVDPVATFERFRNYWLAKPTEASKLDWDATWRNWCTSPLNQPLAKPPGAAPRDLAGEWAALNAQRQAMDPPFRAAYAGETPAAYRTDLMLEQQRRHGVKPPAEVMARINAMRAVS